MNYEIKHSFNWVNDKNSNIGNILNYLDYIINTEPSNIIIDDIKGTHAFCF